MDDLGSVLLGAGITAIAGLLGLVFTSWNEHRRWLRGERLKAYVSYLDAIYHVAGKRDQIQLGKETLETLGSHYVTISDCHPDLLGSRRVRRALRIFVPAFIEEATDADERRGEVDEAYKHAIADLELAFRRDLGIKTLKPSFPVMLAENPNGSS
ncbi:hypothetical protein [Arthrobacter sp. Br18]|uniref:hypothetical protein n=1 Tax=Arthrobacter sp. Br18 TaxID=1312954 RepID=UPI00047B5CC3|nr:hypothetical protein [Arthrobacter sp. Br18]